MELALTGSAAVVTGAASGIGRACATALAAEGASVGLIDRDEDALRELSVELRAPFRVADVTDEPGMHAALDDLAHRLGGIEQLVCCAGISGPFGAVIDEIDLAAWNAVLAVNVTGPFLAVKHALPHLRRAQHPAVVLMGSDSGFVAAPGMVPYNASKGAVVQLTRALATDLAPDGIRVNCVCPSIVDTPMARRDLQTADFADAGFPVQSPEEVARHVLYLCSPVSRPVNGTTLVSDFGYLARSSFPA
jgi:NAD(P)-dependent dehydrogenase (short-subunit alcohol dehydrogenase family)